MLEIPYIYAYFASGLCIGAIAILGLVGIAMWQVTKNEKRKEEK